ncbi:hypothetical protein ACERZ8_03950 [Tateyamaria armeniaca]|uniref:Uncharacterized protein n=1 Tax=Tateyamaria armeniaca TaxID=2518930 RepID=A0ABW8UPL6_9RHOB
MIASAPDASAEAVTLSNIAGCEVTLSEMPDTIIPGEGRMMYAVAPQPMESIRQNRWLERRSDPQRQSQRRQCNVVNCFESALPGTDPGDSVTFTPMDIGHMAASSRGERQLCSATLTAHRHSPTQQRPANEKSRPGSRNGFFDFYRLDLSPGGL